MQGLSSCCCSVPVGLSKGGRQALCRIHFARALLFDVGLDAAQIDVCTFWRFIARSGDDDATAVAQRRHGLDHGLAVGRAPDHGRAAVVLQRGRQNLRGRSGARIDEKQQRRGCIPSVRVRRVRHLRQRPVGHVRDRRALRQEEPSDVDAAREVASRVPAQVNDQRLRLLSQQRVERSRNVGRGRRGELLDLDQTNLLPTDRGSA
mmetsp:Transcript_28522/g.62416  ORF Transcript_28522/g.62416 Transcript_28522/m.62416 type:complete len:205 (-) Transcript_28522:971-1585(-)